jgi:DNA-binding response OmpR family regulator
MSTGERKQLGKILLKRKLITQAELDDALASQKQAKVQRPLASVLTENGTISENEALRALSEQFGVPGLDLAQIAIDLTHLDLVPREVAEQKFVLPVLAQGEQLFVAIADPTDQRTIDELEFVTGRKVRPYIALKNVLQATVRRAYDAKLNGDAHYFGATVSDETKRQVQGIQDLGLASVPADPLRESPEAPSEFDDVPSSALLPVEAKGATKLGKLGPSLPSDWSTAQRNPKPSVPDKRVLSTGKKVLVVEDEEDIRQLLVHMLKNLGHEVYEADRGLLALERVKEQMPDLIILDAMLPEIHGFEIARRLKGSDKYGKIPILMLSAVHRGWRVAEDAKSSLKIEEYLEKPFRISEVTAVVTRLLAATTSAKRDPEALGDEAKKYVEEGVEAYRAGDLKRATVALKRATEVDPLAFRARYHLGLLYAKAGKPFDAIGELERAVELNPGSFPTLKNLAVLYEQTGFKNKAAEVWERSLQATTDETVQKEVRDHVLRLLQ